MGAGQGIPGSSELVAFLRDTATHASEAGAVEVVETHISWVFLTDRYAYKLKKPVRFEFLDFSTPELRRQACEEEVRLNRRLAPDVYLGVLGVTQDDDGTLELDGRGRTVDWVVQMRRLPAERALDVALREERVEQEDSTAVARFLVAFYAGLTAEKIAPTDYRQRLEQRVRANGDAFGDAPPAERACIDRIQGAQLRYLSLEAEAIGQRAVQGRVVEGHGDLRPEHIYLERPPAIIDCIEFSRDLRTVDVADELSFLAMECERLGDGGVGETVLATYQQTSGDDVPPSLLAFYRSYRACVRAKVELLRRAQQDARSPGNERLRKYIDLAERHAAGLGPPSLIVVGGLMGTGKSTLAESLANKLGAELLSTDRTRRRLLGASRTPAGYGEGNYRPELRGRIYDELFRRASELLGEHRSVILDGAFLRRQLRARAYHLGRQHGALPLYVECRCPSETAQQRIQARDEAGQSESEARAELYDRQAQNYEPPGEDEPTVRVETTLAMSQQLAMVSDRLRIELLA